MTTVNKIWWWSKARNLHTASPDAQTLKLFEELGEIAKGFNKNNKDMVIDGIGDSMVVMLILLQQLGNTDDLKLDDVQERVKEAFTEPHMDIHMVMTQVAECYGMMSRAIIQYKSSGYLEYAHVLIYILVRIAHGMGTTIQECLDIAYDEIKDRKGKLVNGVFVKESDL